MDIIYHRASSSLREIRKHMVDPSLSVKTQAFGARIDDDNVFIPSKLARALERYALGDDAAAIAGFFAAFPTFLAGELGLSIDEVVAAGASFIELIEQSGGDVSTVQRDFERRPRGARHPLQVNRREDCRPI